MIYYWLKGDAYTDKVRFVYTLKGGTKYKVNLKFPYEKRSQRIVI